MTGPVAVDSSALIAILNREAEVEPFVMTLDEVEALVGWPTLFETRIWSLRRNERRYSEWLEAWLSGPNVRTVAFDGALESLATSAYERFGKGRHPAGLNFGDCMTYAVASHHDVPLLFKGRDFAKTDVKVYAASAVL